MLLDITITTQDITTTFFGLVITAMSAYITNKVVGYMKKRDVEEKQKMELTRLHNMKLEAMIFAVISVGPHKEEIKATYAQKLEELIREEE